MRTTEQSSRYEHLDQMSTKELLTAMNEEDMTVPVAVASAIPQIEKVVDAIVERMKKGGRVFYTGAGTSGEIFPGIMPGLQKRETEDKQCDSLDFMIIR